jgi:HAD superfamily hydrolase (TIGR01509 family)
LTRPALNHIAAVIFDMDGVLVDSEPVNFTAMDRVLAAHGLRYSDADDRRFRGRRNADFFAELRHAHPHLPGGETLEHAFTKALVALVQAGCAPRPGIPEVLHRLGERGYRLALASSSVPPVIAATLEALGVRALFETTVSGADVAHGKPAPDIFLEAAGRLRLAPAHCLVIEDSRNGMLAALAAGMACVAVPCPATLDEDFSETPWRVGSLPALLDLLPPRESR